MTQAFIHAQIVRETDKALLIRAGVESSVVDEPMRGDVWLPKSQMKDHGLLLASASINESMREVVSKTAPATRILEIPAWLAKKNDLCFGTRL